MPAVEGYFKVYPYSVSSLFAWTDNTYDTDHRAYSNKPYNNRFYTHLAYTHSANSH